MSKIWFVFKRELKAYLYTPMAYALAAVLLVISGYFFYVMLVSTQQADLRPLFGNLGLITAFLAPVLTMRLLADETRQGTGELLFTNPLTISQAVIGKFLASLAVIVMIFSLTLLYPGFLEYFGNPDWSTIGAGYLGFVLMISVFLAVGTFTSSLTDSQLIAGALGFTLLLLLWIIGWAADSVTGVLKDVLTYMSVPNHFLDFRKGIIDTSNIVFYLSLVVGFLFLTIQVLARKTWNVRGHRLVRGSSWAVLTVAVVGILVLANIMGARYNARWDVTATGEFTLSDQTQTVLNGLDKDVTAIGFFAGDSAIGGEVETLLVEYDKASPHFSYEMVDPERNPAKARQYNVTTTGVVVLKIGTQQRTITGANLFNIGDGTDPSQFQFRGEEAITRALVDLTHSAGAQVYFITGHGGPSLYNEYTQLRGYLEGEGFKLTEWNLAREGSMPQEADVAILAGPKADLTQPEREAIEKYMQGGGTLFLMMDPQPQGPEFTQISQLLSNYGVQLQNTIVVDPTRNYFGDPVSPIPRYEYHTLTEKLINQELSVVLPQARSLTVSDTVPDPFVVKNILMSSSDAWGETRFDVTPNKDPEDIAGPLTMGVAIERKTDTAKTNDSSQSNTGTNPDTSQQQQEQPTEPVAFVMGNSYFALDNVLPFQGNRDLFLNIVNWLAGRESLISIRPKPPVIRQMMLTVADKRAVLYSSVFGLPLLVLLIGGSIWLRRRAR